MRNRLSIIGPGAIGTLLGVGLTRANCDVSMIFRAGSAQPSSLKLMRDGVETEAKPRFVSVPAEIGVQDVVIIAVKSQDIPALQAPLKHLVGPETTVVTAMNGLPWWFFNPRAHRMGNLEPHEAVNQQLHDFIEPRQIVAALLYTNCSRLPDGAVQWHSGGKVVVGAAEPSSGQSRADNIAAMLRAAGLDVQATSSIRSALWDKLVGNAVLNPVSALTRCTIGEIGADPVLLDLVKETMHEIESLGSRLGFTPHSSPDTRLAALAELATCRTSMLHDVLAGRPTEVQALLGPLLQEAARLDMPMRMTSILLALTQGIRG